MLRIATDRRLLKENFAVRGKYVRFGVVWQNCALSAVMLEKTLYVVKSGVLVCVSDLRVEEEVEGKAGIHII